MIKNEAKKGNFMLFSTLYKGLKIKEASTYPRYCIALMTAKEVDSSLPINHKQVKVFIKTTDPFTPIPKIRVPNDK